MREQADRMSQLVRDLLELSRLESGASSPMEHAVDMCAVLASARKMALAHEPRPQHIDVEVDSELFFQHSLNVAKTIFLFYRKGLLSREEAADKLDVTLNLLLNPYR